MTTFIQFAVLGLGAGAIYTLLAQGVVLVYRGSGVVNFAQGAMAMVAAFIFVDLTTKSNWSTLPAMLVVILMVALLSSAIYFGIIRTLRNATTLARVISTLAVFIILEAIGVLHWGSSTELVQPILSTHQFTVGKVSFGEDRLILTGIALGMTVTLWAAFRYTLVGLATRGAAENRRAAAALGWSSDVLATANWALGGALAAAAGILIAPITGVQADQMALLVVPALAAALLGNFSSFPLTFLGGMLLGIAQSEVGNYVHITGASDAFPFFVIAVFLVLGGRGLPLRGVVTEKVARLGTGRIRWRPAIVVVVVLSVLTLAVFGVQLTDAMTSSLGFAVVMLSIVVLTGYAGQLSLAQMSLAGVGAFIAGRLVAGAHWPFELGLLAAIILTVPIGMLFAIPALRTRGFTLAIVTLGLGSAVMDIVFNNPSYIGNGDGTPVGGQTFLGFNIDPVAHSAHFAFFSLILFAICAVVVANLRRGRAGRRLIAVRANERAAAALGISVYAAKVYAFGVAAGIAAVGGVVLGFQFQTILYNTYAPLQSILVVAWSMIGGLGYVVGPIYGALFVPGGIGAWFFDQVLSGLDRWVTLIGGVTLLFYILQDPNGMARFNEKMTQKLMARRRAARTQKPPAAPPTIPEVTLSRVAERTLTVTDLQVRFGGIHALRGASLTVRPGEVAALIGPNGAGKTTLIDAVTGFVKPAGGTVLVDSERIDGWSVHKRARAGVARSFQSLELFEDLTVRENFYAASDPRDARGYFSTLIRPGESRLSEEAIGAIREFDLLDDLDKLPGDLPYGRRRLVAIARAMASVPSILLLDEPAAGLDETESAELARLVRGLADRAGIGILVVEHDMNFVMNISDHITVLDFGQQIAQGTPAQIRRDPVVIAAYLGEPEVEELIAAGSET